MRRIPRKHIAAVERYNKRQPTGVSGISFFRSRSNRRDGTVQRFFSTFIMVGGRRRTRRFCIDTMGTQEAWRRALALRANYEAEVQLQISAGQPS